MSVQIARSHDSLQGHIDGHSEPSYKPSLASLLTLNAPTTPPPERKLRIVNVSPSIGLVLHRCGLPFLSAGLLVMSMIPAFAALYGYQINMSWFGGLGCEAIEF